MSKHLLALPALVALLAGSAVGVLAQSPAPEQGVLVTEQAEPGVERIISDGAGHDLDETHPTNRYDMDGIAIAPDGTVWLRTTYNGFDNTANKRPGSRGFEGPTLVWALGRAGTYELRGGNPPPGPGTFLYVQEDGTKRVIEVVNSDDGGSIPDIEDSASPPDTGGDHTVVVALSDGEHTCRNTGEAVRCKDPSGETTRYLSGTQINKIAAAPDGTIWAVGGYDGENGGLYRITLD